MSKEHDAGRDARLKQLAALLTPKAKERYQDAAERLRQARLAFHEMVADQLQGPLNEQLQRLPRHTLAEKQDIARWVNSELRSMGLAIRCPKTHQGAALHAGAIKNPATGYFQLELMGRGQGHKRTTTSRELFTLELQPSVARIEPLSEYWASKVGSGQKSGKGRGE